MRGPLAVLLSLAACAAFAGAARGADEADSVFYASTIANINRIGLTISNYGFFGNNFINRSPSFEFPLGSGYEHMARAGLWVGAHALADTGAFTGVSTAIVDDAQGSNALGGTEFSPRSAGISQRSRIANSKYYSPAAISDQDLLSEYADQPERPAAGVRQERHTPMRIRIRQEILGFTLPAANGFSVVRLTIINEGPPLRDVWAALYAQLVSGDKNAYSTWPPGAGSGPGSWYYRARGEFDSTRSLYTEHYCASAVNYPLNCASIYCPPWVGLQLLRTLPPAPRTVTFHWWSYSPGDTARNVDAKRYAIMSEDLRMDPSICPIDGSCSPIGLLAVGPFPEIAANDSISVDFAFVGGNDQVALRAAADYASFAASIDYRLPSAPPSPRLLIETQEHRVDYWWDDSPEFASDPTSPAPGGRDFEGYRLYLGTDRETPAQVAQFDLVDSTGFNTGLDSVRLAQPRVVNGVNYRYHWSLGGLKDGFRYWGGITSYDTGDIATPSLESGLSQNKFLAVTNVAPGESAGITVYPNPYRVEARWDQGLVVRRHYLWFAGLPARCVLRIYTLAGDRVFERRLDAASESSGIAAGVFDPTRDRDTGAPALSGASFAWDLITDRGQATATGLYLWSVEDLGSRKMARGKFLLVKSDRE